MIIIPKIRKLIGAGQIQSFGSADNLQATTTPSIWNRPHRFWTSRQERLSGGVLLVMDHHASWTVGTSAIAGLRLKPGRPSMTSGVRQALA
jgi:hypothetical protein